MTSSSKLILWTVVKSSQLKCKVKFSKVVMSLLQFQRCNISETKAGFVMLFAITIHTVRASKLSQFQENIIGKWNLEQFSEACT